MPCQHLLVRVTKPSVDWQSTLHSTVSTTMPKFTLITRVSNPLVLAESMETDDVDFRSYAKQLCKTITITSPQRSIIEANTHYYIYIIEKDVCYMTVCENSYPKGLALNYLDELQKEFDIQNGHEVQSARRPYAFVKFDTFIQKTKKLYVDTKSQRNLVKIAEELNAVKKIMTQNIQDILIVGEHMKKVREKSEDLLADSAKYKRDAKFLHTQLFWRKWSPVATAVAIVCFFAGVTVIF